MCMKDRRTKSCKVLSITLKITIQDLFNRQSFLGKIFSTVTVIFSTISFSKIAMPSFPNEPQDTPWVVCENLLLMHFVAVFHTATYKKLHEMNCNVKVPLINCMLDQFKFGHFKLSWTQYKKNQMTFLLGIFLPLYP